MCVAAFFMTPHLRRGQLGSRAYSYFTYFTEDLDVCLLGTCTRLALPIVVCNHCLSSALTFLPLASDAAYIVPHDRCSSASAIANSFHEEFNVARSFSCPRDSLKYQAATRCRLPQLKMLTGRPRFLFGCTCGMARNLRKATPVDGMKAALIGTARPAYRRPRATTHAEQGL